MRAKFYCKFFLLNVFLLFQFMVVYGQYTYIHCGKLIDVERETIHERKTIIINGRYIEDVVDGYIQPRGDVRVIDLKDATVSPGWFDMHVHIESETNSQSYVNRYRLNPEDIAFNSTVYAKRTLMAGFTTVRDLGGSGVNTALRKAIASHKVVGPRIFSAGKSIATTGGHADPTNGLKRSLMGDPGPIDGVVNGVDDAKKAVRQRYKNGADVIKITATGGVLSVAKDGKGPQFDMDELHAIVSTAKDYGMLTAAHAHGAEGMKRAVKAGIKTIEHGTFMTKEVMKLMKKHDTYLCPTITAGKEVEANAKIKDYYPAIIVPKALEVGPQLQGTFNAAYKEGVNIVFGSDAGVFPHGENAREFIYMNDGGMPMLEAFKTATIIPAKLLQVDDKLGTIEKGKWADIIAMKDDPTQKRETVLDVIFVMKEGKIYKHDEK